TAPCPPRPAGPAGWLPPSSRGWGRLPARRGPAAPSCAARPPRLSPCDLVIVEGFKHAPIPKLEVWRRVTGEPLLHPNDPHIVAVASDSKVETRLPLLELNDDAAISSFILAHLRLQ